MSQAQSHVSLFLTCSALSVFITPTAMSPMVFNVGMVHTSFPSCAFQKSRNTCIWNWIPFGNNKFIFCSFVSPNTFDVVNPIFNSCAIKKKHLTGTVCQDSAEWPWWTTLSHIFFYLHLSFLVISRTTIFIWNLKFGMVHNFTSLILV